VSTAPPSSDRIVSLDILRGVAVMGIFSVNVIGFAMPDGAYANPAAYGGESGANLAVWAGNFVLIDNKMRTLFSVLFGASLLLVIDRAEANGRSAAAVHFSRMGWLLLFGLAHFYLVWDGDILSLYAPVGMIAFAFRRMPVERLVSAAIVFLLLDAAMMGAASYAIGSAEAAALAPGADAAAATAFRADASGFLALTPAALARDMALYGGSYAGILHERITNKLWDPLISLAFIGPQTLGLMLLGMAGLRSGFLAGDWPRRTYRRVARLGLGLGALGHAVIAFYIWYSGFSASAVAAGYFILSMPFYFAMTAGYAAAILLLARSGGGLTARVAAAGRAAFTNYLGTSLIASAAFYGYGLGLYGRLDRLHAWLIVPLMWLLMLAWSKPWLDRFRYGPFEWAWRSLARSKLQPMRL
jgi:uncharacterized protein